MEEVAVIVMVVLVVIIIGLLAIPYIWIDRIANSGHYDSQESKPDRIAWGGFVLLALALIVRFIIGVFKLLLQVARGMGKD